MNAQSAIRSVEINERQAVVSSTEPNSEVTLGRVVPGEKRPWRCPKLVRLGIDKTATGSILNKHEKSFKNESPRPSPS